MVAKSQPTGALSPCLDLLDRVMYGGDVCATKFPKFIYTKSFYFVVHINNGEKVGQTSFMFFFSK